MTLDPGTIYSDDEVECYSEDETEVEDQTGGLGNPDPFFQLMESEGAALFNGGFSTMQHIKKYMSQRQSHNVDATIARVRQKLMLPTTDSIVHDLKEANILEEENGDTVDPVDKLELKDGDVKRKKKKRAQKAVVDENRLQKEMEESRMLFEHAPQPQPDVTFNEMNLYPPILKGIAQMGYIDPTPIQSATIPIALRGRDICGCAATGTGKTAAFMLPILQRLLFKASDDASTKVLVLVPTRELGVQVFEVSEQLAKFTKVTISLTVGGLSHSTQTEELMRCPDIIIATPGRLIDHIHNTPNFSLREIEILVLDEADRMLDEFFVEQLNEIVRQCGSKRQTMLYSATMTDEVKDLATVSLKNPVRVFVNNNTDVAQNLRQEFICLKSDSEELRLAVLAYLLIHQFKEECMVFVPRKIECHKLHVIFGLLGVKCGELHGNLKQHQRLESLQKFRDRAINVLFATDVAARGLDIKGVKTIINYTVPRSYESYVHRVGRTARAGYSGRSVTLAYVKGADKIMLSLIRRKSLYPLYKRVVDKRVCQHYESKIEDLQESVDQVLALEKEEKEMQGMMKQIEDSEAKLLDNSKPKNKKDKKNRQTLARKKRRNELFTKFKTRDDVKNEKERLKAIIEGKPDPNQKKSKKNKDKAISPKTPKTTKKPKKKKSGKSNLGKLTENSESSEIIHSNRKSNFGKELTFVSQKSVKALRKGPSYHERKEAGLIKNKKRK